MSSIRKGICIVTLLLATLLTASVAQDSCSNLLKFGIFDQFDTAASSQDFKLLQGWLCDTDSSDFQRASQSAGSGGINLLDIVSLFGGGGGGSSENDSKYHQFCTSSYADIQHNGVLVQQVRSINSNLMAVVKHCLDTQQTGFVAWIETSQDRSTFSYHARYRPNGNEFATITETLDIIPKSVEDACKQTRAYSLFKSGKKIGNAGIAMSCPVDPKTTVTLTLNVNKNGPNGNSFASTLDGVQADPPVPLTTTYHVDAAGYSTAHQWLDTGLTLAPGTNIHITATGQGCLVAGVAASCAGPNGDPRANVPQCTAEGIVCGALFGKIGNGQPFLIGANFTQVISGSGSLFLGYADIDFANNTGGFDVTVVATAPSPPANAHHLNVEAGQPSSSRRPVRILNTVN